MPGVGKGEAAAILRNLYTVFLVERDAVLSLLLYYLPISLLSIARQADSNWVAGA